MSRQDVLDRMNDEALGTYVVPPLPGTCSACHNRRFWWPRKGFFSIYCGYCSDRRLPQPRPLRFTTENPCKAFRPHPEKWDPEERIVRTREVPFGAMASPKESYIPTGDEPLPPEGMTEP